MSKLFNNRVYGCAIIKAINSNYNADFTHRPRTLPDGVCYATDKALKYLVRNYWVQHLEDEHVLYYKRLNADLNPHDLDEAYTFRFGEIEKKNAKAKVLKNLLSCIDIRCFGATFANKKGEKMALSIHGPLQVTHGVNRFPDNDIFSEQIMSPFRDDKKDKTSEASTLGTQHKLAEGHFVHHFSINPQNLTAHYALKDSDVKLLSEDDIKHIKDGMCKGASLYDSSAKAGLENELVLWVELKPKSKLMLPSLVQLVNVDKDGTIDLAAIKELLNQKHVKQEVGNIELYYNKSITKVINQPEGATYQSLI